MSALADILKNEITAQGPLSVARFMELALGHPEYGYYMKKDPFGAGGDFTTAPEISQMFGEVIGAWAADVWAQMGRPPELALLECGPGRGTLMADILRATQGVSGFCAAARVHLLEMSPVLREKQRAVLGDYDVAWHADLAAFDFDGPVIAIANEFLDALPVHQFIGGQERKIDFEPARGFYFMPESGEISEKAPARDEFVKSLSAKIKTQGGAALLIDYGHVKSGPGDTLQALYKHKYVPVFEHIGDADITAHVDFESIARAAAEAGMDVHGPAMQGAFLSALGIEARAAYLKAKTPDKALEIENSLQRLVASDQMGALFKVMCLSHGNIRPAGF